MAGDHALPLASSAPSWSVSTHPAAAAAAVYYLGLSFALAQGRAAGVFDLGGARRLGCRWSRAVELALREKVAALERQIEELRHRRTEDARANEKAKREEEAAELRRQLEEQRDTVALRDRALEQEVQRRQGAEERVRAAERAAKELRERAGREALEHAAEVRKHKAAFVELASAQRQLEADLARATRLVDTAEAELRAALELRDEAAATAAELSAEAARLRRDADHKDKILSAMLRKSKIDMEDREMLVREVKMCKARRKQAELEPERWRKMWESRGHRRGSSRSSARGAAADLPAGSSDKLLAHDAVARATNDTTKILFVDHVEGDGKKDHRQAPAKELTTIECVDRYASHVDDKPAVEEYQGLQEWFQMETEKYRHTAEIEAFTEQLRLKDEKLEAFRWRAVSMDVEATRLRSRIQELEGRLARHEKHSAGLEVLLLDRANENRALEEQLETLQAQAPGVEICTPAGGQDDGPDDQCIPCSPVKVVQRTMSSGSSRHQEGTEVSTYHRAEAKLDEPVCVSPEDHKEDWKELDVHAAEALVVSVGDLACAAAVATSMEHERHDNAPATASRRSFRSEIEEEKEVYTDPGNAQTTGSSSQEQEATSELALVVLPPGQKSSAWKTDIHALAVSYKIKRLKQQLLVLEKLANECKEEAAATKPSGSEASCSSSSRQQPRSRYHTMMSFLSKHVKRYQSLDDKIDDLCARMEESKRSAGRERHGAGEQSQSQSAALGQFLEETFQLQRFMVATGQKLLETQSRIAPGLARDRSIGGSGGDEDGVDMKRLMEVAGALLRDVQRGLEVRIARIIGDLEGTLTFHGILRTTR
ncbi:unnamed protein product [Miscanthus lutarioriparius]|uniref:Uncharacterized protein n=1 Tax=Miscanthus lutarioriparius TaxID=422564 RepID=A0A811PBM8_9POAL|nr:unnamed protein product [Miscanthus lutarioriparius]